MHEQKHIDKPNGSIFNQNCYDYLSQIKTKIPAFILDVKDAYSDDVRDGLQNNCNLNKYDETYPYGLLYANFIQQEDQIVEMCSDKLKELTEQDSDKVFLQQLSDENVDFYVKYSKENYQILGIYDRDADKKLEHIPPCIQDIIDIRNFFSSIFINGNDNLQRTFDKIKDIVLNHRPTDPPLKTQIKKVIAEDDADAPQDNPTSPSHAGSRQQRVKRAMNSHFKLQETTNIPSIINYSYMGEDDRIIYLRMGTQAQRHEGGERLRPAYKLFLDLDQHFYKAGEIRHLYNNKLPLDRYDLFEGPKEKRLSEKIHEGEEGHPNFFPNTTPADQGTMNKNRYKMTDSNLDSKDVVYEFLNIASKNSDSDLKIKDFRITEKKRELIFAKDNESYSNEAERNILQELLEKSFKAHGINIDCFLEHGGKISPAQAQAVWYHFINFQLADYKNKQLVSKLSDNTYLIVNDTCKDGIDRGGAASIYYHLMKSIESGKPLSYEEFCKGIDAAPTSILGRGMNHHRDIIWNAIDSYVRAHYTELKDNQQLSWLIKWRDFNCPHERVEGLLEERLNQLIEELNSANIDDRRKISITFAKINLERVRELKDGYLADKEEMFLWLESIVRIRDVIIERKGVTELNNLANDISENNPISRIFKGLINYLVGLVNNDPSMRTSGIDAMKSGLGFFSPGRSEMVSELATIASNPRRMDL